MSSFAIVLADGPYHQVFAELVESLHWGLAQLGHDVERATFQVAGVRNIVIAPQLLLAAAKHVELAPGTIVYNGEPHCSPLFVRSLRLLALRQVVVWDYSAVTTAYLRGLGLPARHVPYAWCPSLWRAPLHGPQERSVDVLFLGSISERRRRVLEDLQRRAPELNVCVLFGCFGSERDRWLLRSKVVLNVHHWADSPSEDLRLLLACANQVAVVSEGIPDEPYKADWASWAPYEDLVARCRELVAGDGWKHQAVKGFASVQRFDAERVLRPAVESLTEAHSGA